MEEFNKKRLCMIRRYADKDMENMGLKYRFDLILGKITRISFNKIKTTLFSSEFYPIEYEEIRKNNSFIDKKRGNYLVNEIFSIEEDEIEHYKKLVNRFNRYAR